MNGKENLFRESEKREILRDKAYWSLLTRFQNKSWFHMHIIDWKKIDKNDSSWGLVRTLLTLTRV